MVNIQILVIAFVCILFAANASAVNAPNTGELTTAIEKLRPLHKKLGKPGPHDWLAHHFEPGQTFREYLDCNPVTPRGKRHVIYIQPIGDFTETQRKIITLTADFMGLFYNLPVKTREDFPLSMIPAKARRRHPSWGMEQILTTYILHDILRPRLPDDAAVYLALTASDLSPGEGWNFVFGQASLGNRVGVWSIYRNGDPGKSTEEFRLCLIRTMKTAVHETGHMFSIHHCIKYQCCMCGSNHREEADRRPLWLCPECVAKVCWATGIELVPRYRKLEVFCRENGLKSEEEFYNESIRVFAGFPESSGIRRDLPQNHRSNSA